MVRSILRYGAPMLHDVAAPVLSASHSPIRVQVQVMRASDEELAAHRAMCERIDRESKGRCLWQRLAIGG